MVDYEDCLDTDCVSSHQGSIKRLEEHGYVVLNSWLSDTELLRQYHDWHDPLVSKVDLDLWVAAIQGE